VKRDNEYLVVVRSPVKSPSGFRRQEASVHKDGLVLL
jgi:hypothetical protein